MGYERRDPATGLTDREARFAFEYVQDGIATAAYRRAGFTGTSEKYAYELLKRPAVRSEIDRCRGKALAASTVDAARVTEELVRVAMADPRNLFDAAGVLKPVTEWTRDDAACIASVDVVRRTLRGDGQADTILKLRMWDKAKALELLARHLGMLTDKIEIKGEQEIVTRLAAARRRVAEG